MKVLGLVPARAGSKGLPGKNTRDFCGKSLIAWAIEVGHETCDETWVSTEDEDIAALADFHGASGIIARPEELAQDDTPMLPVIQDALGRFGKRKPDIVVLLQPTAPLRAPGHVREALRLLEARQADSVVSVVQVPLHCSPDYVGTIKDGRLVFPLTTRRQDTKPAYYRDGTVYAFRREFIEAGEPYGHRCFPLVIPAEASATIDTEEDWQRAEAMMSERLVCA